jgi:antitoxin component YwqK of YwqJK toxin-antitoxin module
MKSILFIFSIFGFSSLFGQLGQPLSEQSAAAKPSAPACRELLMVRDCSGYVYTDVINVNGRDEEIVFHSQSGKPFTGECKVCYNTDFLKMHLNYVNGRLVGVDTIYYENGNINLITSHDALGYGKEDGTWKFYREDGTLKWEKTYEMGLAQGEHRFYFPDSTLFKIEVYKDNELHGKKQEYYKNHTLKKEIEYKNGKWDGKYITYFEDGKVESEQLYIRGKKDGPSSYFYESGFIFYTENHEAGSREGTFKRMYASGRMWTVENYKNDLRDGEFEEYYDNEKNTIKYKATYKKGVLISEMYYDEFGGEVMSPERIEEIRKAKEAEKAAAEAGTDVDPDEAGGAATEEEGKKKKKKKK